MHEYLAARTAFFDRIVVGALDGGVRQVVIGGAGYDGRALRYAKPGVSWFEVDHPATQADKRERLDRLGLDAAQVRFVAADFAKDPVADLLLAAGLAANAPGLFLLEGVAVYLAPAVVDAILDQFRQVAGAGSRLAISVSLSGEYDRAGRADFRASVAARGSRPGPASRPTRPRGYLPARDGWSRPAPTARRIPRRPPGASGCARSACSRPALDRERRRTQRTRNPEHPRNPKHPASRARKPKPQQAPPRRARAPSRYRPCCPRPSSRSRSSATTKPNTGSRTARRTTGPPPRATAHGWCRWSCMRTA